MNKQELTVENQPVLIIDDLFADTTCSDWLNFYTDTSFKLSACEKHAPGFWNFVRGLELFDVENIFGMSKIVLPLLHEWNEKHGTDFKYTDMHRAHVNLIKHGDKFTGHVDYDHNDDVCKGLVFLWFGNPFFEDLGGGFYLGENEKYYVENNFNRCVMFPAELWHKIEEVKCPESIRLTVYMGFRKDDSKIRTRQYSQTSMKNVFNRDTTRYKEINEQLSKDYGVVINYG